MLECCASIIEATSDLHRAEGPLLIFILFVAIAIGSFILSHLAGKKRTAAMRMLAAQMGFDFCAAKDRQLARELDFLKHLSKGSNRYAHNVLRGVSPDGEPVMIFDYRYEVSSGESTTVHQHSVFLITLPRRFPELQIEPEGLKSRLMHAVGLGDIDFESIEFSKAFDVRSRTRNLPMTSAMPA
ncbi:MAG: hypothetical protein R3242_04925 [Akkermansiaceae bacterium]|nr:hypothetical protein [Akkermansiaceae bacterium]